MRRNEVTSPSGSPTIQSPKILIVGDVGVGKSTLVKMIQRLANPRDTTAKLDALPSTIGVHCECVCFPDASSDQSNRPITFVEIGGNRSFRPECRAPAYCLSNISAIIFVCVEGHCDSIIPLKYWCEELQQYDLIPRPSQASSNKIYPRMMVVKLQHTTETQSLMSSYYNPSRGGRTQSWVWRIYRRSTANTMIPVQVKSLTLQARRFLEAALSVVRRMLLIVMSVVLFGPNQKVIPFSAPTSDSTLNYLLDVQGALQTQVCVANFDSFLDTCGALVDFIVGR